MFIDLSKAIFLSLKNGWRSPFLIFDIWLQQSFPFDKNDKED